MQKKFFISYLLIIAILFMMMSLSRHSSDKMRGESITLLAPLWEKILSLKYFITHPTQPSPFSSLTIQEEFQKLQLENKLLETEIGFLQKQLNEQLLLSAQIEQISSFSNQEDSKITTENNQSLQKRSKIINWRMKAFPARIIFRSFDTWDHSLWINVGESSNTDSENPLIAKNSPVVIGCAIVGLIDYVGEHQSRVCLITNSNLTPSVRAARGGEHDYLMSEQIENLLQQLKRKKHSPLSSEDHITLIRLLNECKQKLQPMKKTWFLAKGELSGSISPSKLGHQTLLKGTGFNYDYEDEEGDNRDLRDGKSLKNPQAPAIPILKTNDVLVTTGMDGIFPPGFEVAIVTQIELLKEGDYFYNLKAKPIAGPLEELSLVFVLPPLHKELIQD